MDREAALELLRNNHEFPGSYEFRVVVRAGSEGTIVAAMAASAAPAGGVEHVRERPSRMGTYVALGVRMRLASAEQVLDVYEVLRALDGVITSM